MNPITRQDMYFEYHIDRLVEEQKATNKLLKQLLDTLKPPAKEVEQVDTKRNVGDDKRKRR